MGGGNKDFDKQLFCVDEMDFLCDEAYALISS